MEMKTELMRHLEYEITAACANLKMTDDPDLARYVAAMEAADRRIAELGGLQWVKITSEADLPAKPGLESYEQIDCLIWHKGEPKFSVWNCEHRVWDDASGDDWFCNPLDPTHYAIIEAPSD